MYTAPNVLNENKRNCQNIYYLRDVHVHKYAVIILHKSYHYLTIHRPFELFKRPALSISKAMKKI